VSRFTTRVELHYAHEEDYKRLHEEMAKEGFGRIIYSSEGRAYYMPPAEYNLVSDLAIDKVTDKAAAAAKRTGKKFEVLVTEGTRQWQGLKEVSTTTTHT
jgi:hypothetical protein